MRANVNAPDAIVGFAAFFIPVCFIVAVAFARKSIRASALRLMDFCLGTELLLAALASDLVYGVGLAHAMGSGGDSRSYGYATFVLMFLIALSVMLLICVISLQQDWEILDRDDARRAQISPAGVMLANVAGIGMFAAIAIVSTFVPVGA